MIKAIIVDDIENSRITLKHDLEQYCKNVKVIGEADSVKSGIALLNKTEADVVFLDIQMDDGTGFNILENLKEINFKIIFTTALDSYGIKAIKFSALDYLLKPVDPDELVAAVNKLKDESEAPGINDNIQLLLENLKNANTSNKRLALNSADRVHMVAIDDIIRCESQGNYTIFHLPENEQIVVTKTLKEYENLLDEYSFVRVHHSHLINLDYMKEFVKKDGGYAIMKDGSHVPVSFRKRDRLMRILGL
jgi:two-component system LytT family response regulator